MSIGRVLWVVGVAVACLGAVPARAGLSWVQIDELTVPGTGGIVTSAVTLGSGLSYKFEASGTYYANDGIWADAEYASGPTSYAWIDGVERYLQYGPNLLDLKVNGGFVDWGPFSTNNVYDLAFTGVGAPVTFNIYDIAPDNNSGSLNVKVYALVPVPAAVLLGALGFGVAGLKLRKFV